MEKKRLTGDRNQCPRCDQFFNSSFAFDMHRRGMHGVNRCCATVDDMLTDGMSKNSDGFWISKAMPYGMRGAA